MRSENSCVVDIMTMETSWRVCTLTSQNLFIARVLELLQTVYESACTTVSNVANVTMLTGIAL